MDYQQAIDFLYPLHRFGIKPGLERTVSLLEALGSPQEHLGLVIHIAGTNGKGTVAATLASIFQAAGRKVGLYTSPHLVEFTERIRIDGRQIPRERVAEYCTRLSDVVISEHATFFEATTAIAFAWFADEAVDVSVIETGMGGRLDATNVVHADHVVIPSIGLDHTQWLGESLRAIAGEKAAIIKRGSRVYTAVTDTEALDVICSVAASCDAPLFMVGRDGTFVVKRAEPGRLDLDVMIPPDEFLSLQSPLTGSFHASNVTLAVMVAHAAGVQGGDIARGVAAIRETGYRGRLELIGRRPMVFLDVSHNPDGMEKTVQALMEMRSRFRSVHVLLGLASDKDGGQIAGSLLRLADSFTVVNLPVERSFPAESLGVLCRSLGAGSVEICRTAGEGLEKVCSKASPDDMILVTGSFYLAGEIIALWNARNHC